LLKICENPEVLLNSNEQMDAEGLVKKAGEVQKERANARANKLKIYEDAMHQDKEFQRTFQIAFVLLTKIGTCLESMKRINRYFEENEKQKTRLNRNCSIMTQLTLALAKRQGIHIDEVDPDDFEQTEPTRSLPDEADLEAWRQLEISLLGWEPCNDVVDLHFMEVLLRKKCPQLWMANPDLMQLGPVAIFDLYLAATDQVHIFSEK
jgi:hypothetical protein